MKEFKAIVVDKWNGNQRKVLGDLFYETKAECINELRANGYAVNPKKVKPKKVFDFIMNCTNCNPWDWDMTEKEVDQITKEIIEEIIQEIA